MENLSTLHLIAEQDIAKKETIATALDVRFEWLDSFWPALPLRFDAIARELHRPQQEIVRLYSEAYQALKHQLKSTLTEL